MFNIDGVTTPMPAFLDPGTSHSQWIGNPGHRENAREAEYEKCKHEAKVGRK
jgi:hypothetical protein